MNCKKIRDSILTDYIDGQLQDHQEQKIQVHLTQCKECREFMQQVLEIAVLPFKTAAADEAPSPFVWEQIKRSLPEKEPVMKKILNPFVRSMYGLFHIRKPALAFAFTVVIIFAGVYLFERPYIQRRAAVNNYLNEQLVYLASVDANGAGQSSDMFDMGTDIEEFFF